MAREIINLGTPPNGVDGDTIRVAMDKCNNNFQELYEESISGAVIGAANLLTTATITSTTSVDVPGMTTTVVAGSRPLLVSWGGALLTTGGASNALYAVTLYQDSTIASQILVTQNDNYISTHREYLSTNVPAGTSVTFSLKSNVGEAGSSLSLAGNPTDSFYLRVQVA